MSPAGRDLGDNFHFYANDLQGYVTYISPSAAARYGWAADGPAVHLDEVLTDHPLNAQVKEQQQKLFAGVPTVSYREQVRDGSGKLRWLEVSESLRHDGDGQVIGIEGFAHDITEHVETIEALAASQQQLHEQAHHDPLTGLPNRPLLLDKLQQALRTPIQTDGLTLPLTASIGVILMDGQNPRELDQILYDADQRMYSGKNRLVREYA